MKKITALIFISLCFLALAFPIKASAAHFELAPQSLTIDQDTEFNINLYLNTGGKLINGLDAILNFPTDLLEVKEITFSSRFPTNIKSYSNSTGKIEIHSSAFSITDISSENDTVATVKFKTKKEGTAAVYFTCNPGHTDDSNILESGTSDDIIDCNNLKNGEYKIEEGGPTPTPTSQPETCKTPPDPTQLTGKSGPEVGQVTLEWSKILNANHYTIAYGLSSRNYIYGVPDTGDTDHFTISQLTPGKRYYFAITAVNDCGSSGHSNEASITAKSGVSYVYVRAEPTPEVITLPPSEEEEATEPSLLEEEEATASATPSAEPSPTPKETEEPEPQPSSSKDLLRYAGIGLVIFIVILATIKTLTGGGPKQTPSQKPQKPSESLEPPESPEPPPPFPNPQIPA